MNAQEKPGTVKCSLLHRDALTISIVNSLTSILAGFVIFSAFGYMSYLQGVAVTDLAVDGEKTNDYF